MIRGFNRAVVTIIDFLILCAPLSANALTTAEIDAQINLLIQQITTLQTKIQQYSPTPVLTTPTQPTVPVQTVTPDKSCPVIERTLSLGVSGIDVKGLQSFLYYQQLLTQTAVTGYFDIATQIAVQKWQASHGIVSSGTPDLTGYGVVGPRTRALITLNCSLGPKTITLTPLTANDPAPASCAVAPQPVTTCSTGWKAITDYYGCTTSYTCSATNGSTSGNTTSNSSSSNNTQFSIVSPIAGLAIRSGNLLYIAWNPGTVTANYLGLELVNDTGTVVRSIAILSGVNATTYQWWTIPTGVSGVWPGRYKIRASLQTTASPYCATTAGCSVIKTAESGAFIVLQ